MIASRAPRVSGESQGQVTWGIPGAWPYAYRTRSAVRDHVGLVNAVVERVTRSGVAEAVRTHGPGHQIGDPQDGLASTVIVIDVEAAPLWKQKARTRDGVDVAPVEFLLPGFHEQLPDPHSMKLEDQAGQAGCSCSLLAPLRDGGSDGDHVQAGQGGNLLHSLLPLTTGEVVPVQFVVRPPPAETLTQAEHRLPDLFA